MQFISDIDRDGLVEAVAQAVDGIVITDTTGTIRYINPAFTAITGYTSEEAIGQKTSILRSGLQPDAFYARLWSTIRSGQVWHDELVNRRKDGTLYLEEMRITPVRDADGNTVSYIAIKHDVTRQRKAEEAQRFLAAIVEGSQDAITAFTPAGIILTWNRGAELVFGHTASEAIGKHVSMLVPPEELHRLAGFAEEIVRGKAASQYEGLGVRKDGQPIHISVTGCLILNPGGEVAAVSAVIRDISKRKAAQEALRESEERFRIMADSCPTPMWVTNEKGELQFVNRAYRDLLGIPTDGLAMFRRELAFHPADAPAYLGAFRQAVADRSAFRGEARVRRTDGAWRWFTSYAEPRLSLHGEFLGHGGMSMDITELKLAEQVSLRARQSAEEANQAKNRFLAAMSHEIRTPMNAILGMADAIWESDLSSDQRQFVEVIRRAGSNLLVLINDILDLSKIEAGHLELEKVDFDLEEVVDQVIELIGVKTRDKGVALLCQLAAGVPVSVNGDPVRLRQILTNLLGNAAKFTDSGEIVLRIQHLESGAAGEIEFLVSDTGIGIPADKLDTIFDAFTQADVSTTRKYGGTGLGLGISRRLVEIMGGRLSVTSSIGSGSTFRFSVPFEAAQRSRKTNADQDFHGRSVLVIGDNATNRLILRETLNGWGFATHVPASPQDALEDLDRKMACQQPYALVVLDRQGREMDGFQTVARIRQLSPDLPVVMLTSDAASGDVRLRKEAGLAGYAVNPVKRAELLRLVCEALQPRPNLKSNMHQNPDRRETLPVRSLHILLAEDSPDNRMLIEVYLKGSPHRLTFAENGQAAVGKMSDGQYDLILMDIRMPVMDGLSATRAIRALERQRASTPIPIIALSANAAVEDVAMSREAGCDAHLSKPISKIKLLQAIEEHCPRPKLTETPKDDSCLPIPVEMVPELQELIPDYVAARRKEVPEMMQLLAASDFDRITVLSHDLKGTGGGYGLPELTRIGAALNDSAKQTDHEAVGRQLAELSDYLSRVQLIAKD